MSKRFYYWMARIAAIVCFLGGLLELFAGSLSMAMLNGFTAALMLALAVANRD